MINHLGVSGGKDSTALLLWAMYESGYDPHSLRVTFCNTLNEHRFTYWYVLWLSAKVKRIKWLEPALGFYELAKKKRRFPSAKARFCTTELKIRPSRDYVWELLDRYGKRNVTLHTGVRATESPDRATLPERDFDPEFLCDNFRPLLRWTLEEVWAIHARHGIPPNPLYGVTESLPWNGKPNPFHRDGMRRVGCYPCIMSRKDEIEKIARKEPERIAWISEQEKVSGRAAHLGFTSFFNRNMTPVCQRSHMVTTKTGEDVFVPTINDVARWSTTTRGGVQYKLDLDNGLEEEFKDEPAACSSRYGFCE